jgi:hypothetical protein
MKKFKGSKYSHAKWVAEELFNEMQNTVDGGAELFASDIYTIAKCCAYKVLEISKMVVLDGWDYDEVTSETQAQHDFWELVGKYLVDIE